VDRRPVLCLPDACADSDAIIVPPDEVGQHAGGDRVVLADVSNSFQPGFYEALRLAPKEAGSLLDAAVESVRSFMDIALDAGADGIFYRVRGATAGESTPMQYGGHFLERDRDLLERVKDATLNVVFVEGSEDVYLDFVSDLPALLFAWDSQASGYDAAYVRTLRNGAQASADPDSEVELRLAPAS
jgi:hypothetical protein